METDPSQAMPESLRTLPSYVLTHAAMPAGRMAGEAMARVGGHKYFVALLAALAEFGPASQAELGRRSGIDRSDVVAALNDLAAAGNVERAPDPADRRRNVVTITDAGREQLEKLLDAAGNVQREIFAPLSDEEVRQLTDLLTRVLDHHRGRP